MKPHNSYINTSVSKLIHKTLSSIIIIAFSCTSVQSPGYAQSVSKIPWMPKPGTMLNLSVEFTPAHLKGLVIHPDNALQFDFIINKGDENLTNEQKEGEYKKLIKYFLASLAVPDEDQWVNLSPYEKDRIIKDDFGKTEMGRDLLAQDYLLKQITASLIYPESNLGQKFWDTVYSRAQQQYGTSNIPLNTFNKVWIVPDEAYIYEKENTVYIVKQHLKVMLEQDYLSLSKHAGITHPQPQSKEDVSKLGSEIVRDIVLPELEKEINEGKNFAALRQVYSGMLLAAWYKRSLKESLLGKIYADRAKVKGIDQDPQANQEIYQQYLKAFKKGVFNYIKEDVDKYTHEAIPRKYFSGGTEGFKDYAIIVKKTNSSAVQRDVAANGSKLDAAVVDLRGDKEPAAKRIPIAYSNTNNREIAIPIRVLGDEAMQTVQTTISRLQEISKNKFLGDNKGQTAMEQVVDMTPREVLAVLNGLTRDPSEPGPVKVIDVVKQRLGEILPINDAVDHKVVQVVNLARDTKKDMSTRDREIRRVLQGAEIDEVLHAYDRKYPTNRGASDLNVRNVIQSELFFAQQRDAAMTSVFNVPGVITTPYQTVDSKVIENARSLASVLDQLPFDSTLKATRTYEKVAGKTYGNRDFYDGESDLSNLKYKDGYDGSFVDAVTSKITSLGIPGFAQRKRGLIGYQVTSFSAREKLMSIRKTTFYNLRIVIQPDKSVPHVDDGRNAGIWLTLRELTQDQLDAVMKIIQEDPQALAYYFKVSERDSFHRIYNGFIEPGLNAGFYNLGNLDSPEGLEGVKFDQLYNNTAKQTTIQGTRNTELSKAGNRYFYQIDLSTPLLGATVAGRVKKVTLKGLAYGWWTGENENKVQVNSLPVDAVSKNNGWDIDVTSAVLETMAETRTSFLKQLILSAPKPEYLTSLSLVVERDNAMTAPEALRQANIALQQIPTVKSLLTSAPEFSRFYFDTLDDASLSPIKKLGALADRIRSVRPELTQTVSTIEEKYKNVIVAGDDQAMTSSNRKKILVIDDDASVSGTVKMILTRKMPGYEVVIASTGEQAETQFKPDEFALIISDTNLAGESGYDVVKNLQDQDPGVKVVAMTGNITEQNTKGWKALSEQSGKQIPVLEKPFGLAEFTETIQKQVDSAMTSGRTKILILDDDKELLEMTRDLLGFTLGAQGIEVVTASTGDEAVTLFKPDQFAVILSDTNLTNESGYNVVQKLHALDPKVNIVAMSGITTETNLQGWRDLSTVIGKEIPVVAKPFNLTTITNAVKTQMDQGMRAVDDLRTLKEFFTGLTAKLPEHQQEGDGVSLRDLNLGDAQTRDRLMFALETANFFRHETWFLSQDDAAWSIQKNADGTNTLFVYSVMEKKEFTFPLDNLIERVTRAIDSFEGRRTSVPRDTASSSTTADLTKGGIDLNAANLNLQIKRDGKGIPLPISQQDFESINIEGLVPVIMEIKPAAILPVFSELNVPAASVQG